MDQDQQMPSPDKAIVLLNKGQNFFNAFFAELALVRKQLPNDREFADWCFDVLHVPVITITRYAQILEVADAERQKYELAGVRTAADARLQEERNQRKALADAERKRREDEKAAAAAKEAEKRQKREMSAPTVNARVSQLLARIRELEAQLAEARAIPKEKAKPLRDRADYMRDYMRRRRAAAKPA
jgi:hypothetical protein